MVTPFIVPILVISGAATAGAFCLALAPRTVARLVSNVSDVDGLTDFVLRYVGLLVGLIGCLTIYSAYHPDLRPPVLSAAILEKLFFASFVLAGRVKRTPILVVAAIADACFALLYIAYLAGY